MTRVLLSNSHVNLNEALEGLTAYAVVEAEYGSNEVRGSSDLLTLNHHVDPSRPCPCSLPNDRFDDVRDDLEAVGISHMDLDTLGGLAALLGRKPHHPTFWTNAAFIDTNGAHRLHQSPDYSRNDHELLAAFWAWSQKNRLYPERDGSVTDVTDWVLGAITELELIVAGIEEKREEGRAFLANEDKLRKDSFVSQLEGKDGDFFILRKSDAGQFVNHLYYAEDGSPANFVVGYNGKTNAVTLSCADPEGYVVTDNDDEIVTRFSAVTTAQELWGMRAGGHLAIAGSPREFPLPFSEAEYAQKYLSERW